MSEAIVGALIQAGAPAIIPTIFGLRSQRRQEQRQKQLEAQSKREQEVAQARQLAELNANDVTLSRRNPRGRKLFADAGSGLSATIA